MTATIPKGFSSQHINLDEITIHTIHNGKPSKDGSLANDDRPVLIMLHGFPEYFGAWTPLIPWLSEHYLMILPDQRGFNLSSTPQSADQYRTGLLVGDMIGVMDKLVPGRSIHLAGHDWGASVAYAMAMSIPERLISLSIVNGVHPITFQRALTNDPAQALASQYFHVLCSADGENIMSANDFEKTFSMFEKFSSKPWLTPEIRREYINAWSAPGAMNAMLNWYRSSPMVIPNPDEPQPAAPLLGADMNKFQITMPHLVIWGMEDTALLPSSREGLAEFASDLTIEEVANAGHWIIHTDPELIAGKIHRFLGKFKD